MSEIDERIRKLKTPQSCEVFARNAYEHGRDDLARAAHRRAIELKAESHGAKTEAEKLCLEAIYAYERVLTKKNGKTTRANRTWQMIERHGILEAVERAVNRPHETAGYTALVEMGLENLAFEAVVVKYPDLFSAEAVHRCRERMASWGGDSGQSDAD